MFSLPRRGLDVDQRGPAPFEQRFDVSLAVIVVHDHPMAPGMTLQSGHIRSVMRHPRETRQQVQGDILGAAAEGHVIAVGGVDALREPAAESVQPAHEFSDRPFGEGILSAARGIRNPPGQGAEPGAFIFR